MTKTPEQPIESAYKTLYFLAVLNVVLGGAAMAGVGFLQSIGLGLFNIIYGVILGILGGATHATRSVIPLILALLILVGEFVFSIYLAVSQGGSPGGLIIKGLFIFYVGKPIFEQIKAKM